MGCKIIKFFESLSHSVRYGMYELFHLSKINASQVTNFDSSFVEFSGVRYVTVCYTHRPRDTGCKQL